MAKDSKVSFVKRSLKDHHNLELDKRSRQRHWSLFSQARAAFANSALSFLQVETICKATYFKTEIPTFKNNNYCTQIFIKTFQKYNFDGLDLDWEYPGIYTMGNNLPKCDNFSIQARGEGAPRTKKTSFSWLRFSKFLQQCQVTTPKSQN